MTIDVHPFDFRISGSMGRHGAVSRFIRIIVLVVIMGFCVSFQLFYDTVCLLGVILGHPDFNTRRIKDRHICFGRVNGLADWFGKINKLFKNGLYIF